MTSPHQGEKTAFVLAGGGSLGAVQVGMLKALVRAGLVPDMVVGASVGAINGAFFAGDPTAGGVERIERIWRGLRRSDVFPMSIANSLLGFLGKRDHLCESSSLRRILEPELPCRRLEEARVPCTVVTTDLLEGGERTFRAGPTMELLLASAAIPAVFPPVLHEGRYLSDGGLANNTPVSTALNHGATRVIVLPTGFSCAVQRPPNGTVAMALHALNLMIMRQLLRDMELYASRAQVVVLPPLCPVSASPFDFSQTAELIHRAEAAARVWLKGGGLDKAGAPEQMTPHLHAPEELAMMSSPRRSEARRAMS